VRQLTIGFSIPEKFDFIQSAENDLVLGPPTKDKSRRDPSLVDII